ncbi:MAG: Tex family protein [Sphingomonadaceae bacterium]
MDEIVARTARELSIPAQQVASAADLLDAGNTIPFIARYRKEATGSLDEVQLQAIQDRLEYLRNLEKRREEVLRLIDEQGKLTPELADRIRRAEALHELEDLYLPYRPKRKTRASVAREKGLGPLAELILAQPVLDGPLEDHGRPFLDEELGLATLEQVYAGARDIVAEVVAEDAAVRGAMRDLFFREALLTSTLADASKDPGQKYTLYYDFSEPAGRVPPHRVLAINRAEREEVVRVAVDLPFEKARPLLTSFYPAKANSVFAKQLALAVEDGYKRLLSLSLEREVRSTLTKRAEAHAISLFAANLRKLLLQPPLRGTKVMGIDPGYRTGCKVAVVDATGKYLEGSTIYPHEPQKRWKEAKEAILTMARRHGVSAIAIGNGTASRETEALVAEAIGESELNLAYTIVDEAGASVYSASEVARQEFPDLEASQRGNISIARRLQDPLAELVKIDPKSVGVGLYQHDVDQRELARELDRVVISCVNFAGVDVNTASVSLLQYVSGINRRVAEKLVAYRNEHGPFTSRDQLTKVPGLGPATFVQAAGFLKIRGGENPLDDTFIHPESYGVCEKLMDRLPPAREGERLPQRVARFRREVEARRVDLEALAAELGTGVPTLRDILENLEKPGLDPRDSLPKPILRTDVLRMEDLKEGMLLQGTVRNVVDFGAFVDIGVKQDGLVHVSEMADRFVRNPLEVVGVGDVVTVRVKGVDLSRGRIQLSMKGIASGHVQQQQS